MIAFLLVQNNYCMVPRFKVYPRWASQAISHANMWFEYSRNAYTFLKIILSFLLWNPLPPPERGCAAMSSQGLFPHLWHHTTSSLSLQNAWRSAEEKRKHTHRPYHLLLLLLMLGQACSSQPGFCCYTQFEPKQIPIHSSSWGSHLFKQVGPELLYFPKCCCSWTSL